MKTTIQSVVNDAKALLDVAALAHYTDPQLARYAVEGFHRLYALQPSSRYVDGVLDDPQFPTADAALLEFAANVGEPRWRLGVVYFTAGRAHEVGITDSVNLQLAQTLKKQADEIFTS